MCVRCGGEAARMAQLLGVIKWGHPSGPARLFLSEQEIRRFGLLCRRPTRVVDIC